MTKRILIAGLALVAFSAFAETDYLALPKIQDIQKGINNANAIQDLRVQDDAIIVDDLSVGGDVAVTGNAAVAGQLTADGFSTVGILYDPVVSGGTTNAAISLGYTVPANRIIRDAYLYVTEAFEPATPTISIGVGDSVANLMAADVVTNSFKLGFKQLIPDYATIGDSVVTNGLLKVKTSVATVTNGTAYIFLKFDSIP